MTRVGLGGPTSLRVAMLGGMVWAWYRHVWWFGGSVPTLIRIRIYSWSYIVALKHHREKDGDGFRRREGSRLNLGCIIPATRMDKSVYWSIGEHHSNIQNTYIEHSRA